MVELNEDDLNIFSSFEKVTRVMPTDYISTPTSIVFLVSQDSLGRAIGKKASNIEKLRRYFRKRVIVVADSDDPEGFLRSFFGNVTISDIESRNVMGEIAMIITVDEKDRGIAIGRDGERIKAAKALLKKKFNATVHLRTRRESI
jgi:N utilization substance protein A